MKNNDTTQNMIFSALFLSIALLLPFIGGQNPEINSIFCPMHIPIFLCGYICGWKWGVRVGFISPILRSFLFGFPVLYPIALSMAFELAAYGAITAIMYNLLPKKKPFIFCSLISAMLIGRAFRAIATLIFTELGGNKFALSTFMTGVIIKSVPGMIAHLIIVPILIILLEKLLIKYKLT